MKRSECIAGLSRKRDRWSVSHGLLYTYGSPVADQAASLLEINEVVVTVVLGFHNTGGVSTVWRKFPGTN